MWAQDEFGCRGPSPHGRSSAAAEADAPQQPGGPRLHTSPPALLALPNSRNLLERPALRYSSFFSCFPVPWSWRRYSTTTPNNLSELLVHRRVDWAPEKHSEHLLAVVCGLTGDTDKARPPWPCQGSLCAICEAYQQMPATHAPHNH